VCDLLVEIAHVGRAVAEADRLCLEPLELEPAQVGADLDRWYLGFRFQFGCIVTEEGGFVVGRTTTLRTTSQDVYVLRLSRTAARSHPDKPRVSDEASFRSKAPRRGPDPEGDDLNQAPEPGTVSRR